MSFLYNIYVYLHYQAMRFYGLFNPKVKNWVKGRKGLVESMFYHSSQTNNLIWFHCLSHKEFEQARPVMERFKSNNPGFELLITFYSFEGYILNKNYTHADYVFYIPVDTPRNVKKFIDVWNPAIAVFLHYKYSYNYINELHKRGIPLILISALFSKNQHFFRFYGIWFKKQLKKITYLLVQNRESLNLLSKAGVRNVSLSGNTRFDRVYDISVNPDRFEDIEKFIQASIIFIGGNISRNDDDILIDLINKNYKGIKFIIVPNKINEQSIKGFSKRINGKTVRLSDFDKSGFPDAQVLIIDRIGILPHVYQYASVAYVGGGLGKGVHNVLEAAVFGMPVIFGLNFKKYNEAVDLVNYGGAFPVKNSNELSIITYKLLSDFRALKYTSGCSKEYILSKKGAAEKTVSVLNAMISPGNQLKVDKKAFIMN